MMYSDGHVSLSVFSTPTRTAAAPSITSSRDTLPALRPFPNAVRIRSGTMRPGRGSRPRFAPAPELPYGPALAFLRAQLRPSRGSFFCKNSSFGAIGSTILKPKEPSRSNSRSGLKEYAYIPRRRSQALFSLRRPTLTNSRRTSPRESSSPYRDVSLVSAPVGSRSPHKERPERELGRRGIFRKDGTGFAFFVRRDSVRQAGPRPGCG